MLRAASASIAPRRIGFRHITAGDAVRLQRQREAARLRETIGPQVSTTKPELNFAPKKMVLLARQIRRLSVPEALIQMQFSKKRASYSVSKVIQVGDGRVCARRSDRG